MKRPTAILNTEALLGVSYARRHQGHEDWQAFQDPAVALRALTLAQEQGMTTVMSVSDDRIIGLLERVSSAAWSVMAVVPNLYDETRLLERGVLGVVRERFRGVGIEAKCSWMLSGITTLLRLLRHDDYAMLHQLFALDLLRFHRLRLQAVILHAQCTDAALATGHLDLLQRFADFVRLTYRLEPVLATRNFGWLIPAMQREAVAPLTIVAPFNPQGWLMKPDRATCEQVLQDLGVRVIADEVLGDATNGTEEALRYVAGQGIQSAVLPLRPPSVLQAMLHSVRA